MGHNLDLFAEHCWICMHLFIGFIRFFFLRFFFDYLPSDHSPLDEDQRQSQVEEAQAQEKEEDLTANIDTYQLEVSTINTGTM